MESFPVEWMCLIMLTLVAVVVVSERLDHARNW
jgi:hypothetical protein